MGWIQFKKQNPLPNMYKTGSNWVGLGLIKPLKNSTQIIWVGLDQVGYMDYLELWTLWVDLVGKKRTHIPKEYGLLPTLNVRTFLVDNL